MKFVASPGNYAYKLYLAMSKNYLTYQLGHFSAWQTTKIFSHGFLWETLQLSLAKCLSALLRRILPEGYHLYWLNTMKPITYHLACLQNAQPLCHFTMQFTGKDFSKNFRGFDITICLLALCKLNH